MIGRRIVTTVAALVVFVLTIKALHVTLHVHLPFGWMLYLWFWLVIDGIQLTLLLHSFWHHPRVMDHRWFLPLFADLFPAVFTMYVPIHANTGTLEAIGVTLSVVAGLVLLAGYFTLRSSFSILPEGVRLVNKGIYRFVRHPIYSGYLIMVVAWSFLYDFNILGAVYFLVMVSLLSLRSSREESVLVRMVDDETAWHTWMNRTGRFLPRMKKMNEIRG